MTQSIIESFPAAVDHELKTYVYRLIDPRNGETFYVGKGTGNRVFHTYTTSTIVMAMIMITRASGSGRYTMLVSRLRT